MKTDLFTKTTLAVITLALVVIAGQGRLNRITTVHAAPVQQQRWDYKMIRIKFRWQNNVADGIDFVSDGGTKLDGQPNILDFTRNLGTQGWELVSVTPFSLWSSGGSSTDEVMMFKRPLLVRFCDR